jgi:hypothetical protein
MSNDIFYGSWLIWIGNLGKQQNYALKKSSSRIYLFAVDSDKHLFKKIF